MGPLHHFLRIGEHVDLGQRTQDCLHVVHANGRGIQVDVPAGWVSVWWPVRGRLLLSAGGNDWELASRGLQVWRDATLRCRSFAPQGWLAVAGPQAAWSPAKDGAASLFPWQGRASRTTAGLLARLARGARVSASRHAADADVLLAAFADSLLEQQRALHALLPRCNGRTVARKRQTLTRMLRVRHAIVCNPDIRLDLESLAAAANYSPCHLIRVYRAIFGETPSDYAIRLRSERAWALVRDTRMPVCEITEALGFESQSSFCRAFKSSFGATTSEVRRSMQAAERPSSRRYPGVSHAA